GTFLSHELITPCGNEIKQGSELGREIDPDC
ncbi:hypothetical protein CEXT_737441, partial [Caerostris extrusa]